MYCVLKSLGASKLSRLDKNSENFLILYLDVSKKVVLMTVVRQMQLARSFTSDVKISSLIIQIFYFLLIEINSIKQQSPIKLEI